MIPSISSFGGIAFTTCRLPNSATRVCSHSRFFQLIPQSFGSSIFSLMTYTSLQLCQPSYSGLHSSQFCRRLQRDTWTVEAMLKCSLVAAFFPVVFVFTSIAYSESLFLFLSLVFWLEYVKLRIGRASLVLAAATLTRPFGVLLSIPLIIEMITRKQLRPLAYLFIPFFSVLAWLYYGFYSTGFWLAFRQAEVTFWPQTDYFRGWIIPLLTGGDFDFYALSTFVVVLFGYLVYLTFQEDWRLGILSLTMYASVMLFSGPPVMSYLRYFSFIFPIWILAGKVRSWSLLITYCVFMSLNSMMILNAFALGSWIG